MNLRPNPRFEASRLRRCGGPSYQSLCVSTSGVIRSKFIERQRMMTSVSGTQVRVLCCAIPLIAAVVGCSRPDAGSAVQLRGCWHPPFDVSRLEREFRDRGIAYTRDGDCLTYGPMVAVEAAVAAAFGDPPPPGRSIGYSHEAVTGLAKGGVDVRVVTYAGQEWIVWNEDDVDRAESLLDMSPEMKEKLKLMRDENKLLSEVSGLRTDAR